MVKAQLITYVVSNVVGFVYKTRIASEVGLFFRHWHACMPKLTEEYGEEFEIPIEYHPRTQENYYN